MKSKTITLLLLLVTAISTNAATISQWTFEVNTPADLNNSTTSPSVAADVGSGTASGLHASAGTDWSTPAGNGSVNSLSANNWASGDYFQFQLSTVGYQDIVVSWHQTRSTIGPALFDLAYSLNGVDFTIAEDNYAVPENTWSSSGSPNGTSIFSKDLSSVFTLDNHSTIFFRLIADSAPGGTSGASRVDNVVISGTAIASVPDSSPGWFGLGCVVAFLAFASRRQELTTLVR